IFGNANEDDTINMEDVECTERIILGLNDHTQLADAKYDNRINMQDVTQIELIILRREKELTILDSANRIVTVKKPVERIIALTYPDAEAIKIVKAGEKIVGISEDIKMRNVFYPELSKLPSVGVTSNPDLEKIIELNSDIVFTGKLKSMGDVLENNLPDTIAVTCWDMGRLEVMIKNIQMLGYVFDKGTEAEQFCNFYQEYIDEMIKGKVSELSDDDKQRVYFEHIEDYKAFTTGSSGHEVCAAAGGINIAADLAKSSEKPIVQVDQEWLIEQNPDVIIKTVRCKSGLCGYEENNSEEMNILRDSIMNRPGWESMTAVKNNRVYLIDMDLIGSTANFVGATYVAKWLYPDIFEHLDPQAFHQQYLIDFQQLDYDLSEQGVFICPD
ncbi:MAG: ABC transporter substrate-binding protein, partial [Methanophagales archaeon]|nr:ABC transporter substrate-binding protein [Methanophagales archaeon]